MTLRENYSKLNGDEKQSYNSRGTSNPNSKLKREDVLFIKKRWCDVNNKSINNLTKILCKKDSICFSYSTIRKVINGERDYLL
jgi:hypothetical protein